MRDQVSPLVAKGDPLSLMKAQQALRQSSVDKQQQALQKRDWMSKIGERVRARIKEEQLRALDQPTENQGYSPLEPEKRAGVPRGVAEAFPEEAQGRKIYGKPGTLEEPLQAVQKASEVADTPGRVFRGIAAAAKPGSGLPFADLPGNIRTALTNGQSFRGIDTAGVSKLPDEGLTAGPLHITPKTVAGLGIETVTDPSTWIGVGGLRGGVKAGVKEGAGEAVDPVHARIREAVQAKFKPGAAGAPVGGGAPRTGNRLLQLPDSKQLQAEIGHPPELKDIFNVDRMGRRESTAQANRLRSQATLDFRELGKTTKDSKGNLLVRGIAPDAQDIARGQEYAPLLKVLEKPQNYNLTPEQAQAVQRIATIPELVKNERNAFGVGPRTLEMNEGEQFIWRKAKTDSKGTPTNKPRPSSGGTRLGGGGDKSRVFEDIDEALDAGVVYAHPQEAFDQNVMGGLKRSVDEHVKNMLMPMSDSAAERVSPALRAQNQYLTQRLTSLKGTLGRLDARTRGVVDAYVNAADPDIDALYDELGQVAARSGKLPAEVATELKQTMADIRKLRPAWRREIRQSRSIPAGRAGVPMDVAPALAGRDFEPRVAQKIEDFYRHTARIPLPSGRSLSLRADIPAVRAVSAAITPIRATGDFSAILINQTTTAARHPLTFLKNVAVGFRDMVDDTHYSKWLSGGSADDGARHGLSIVGEAGEPAEFQFSNWMQRVPGIRQINNHYVRLNNRQRVDLYNLAVRAQGPNVDDAAKESIARAINRFTGVSNSRATDAETLASFAPNFTRAHIETVAAALSKGGIEGNMAREYLLTMLGAGGGLVAGVAAAQGRDMAEVLHPLSLDDLKDGKIRINPNFMSVRAFGQDVKVFGKYDSLMRLLAITSDAGLRSALEGDAMQLFDAVGYASGGMGSPAASFLTSLVKGETFEGAAPLSPEGLASNVIPFTGPEVVGGLASAGQNIARGEFGAAGSDLGAVSILAAGGKASPVTAREYLDIETQKRFGVDYKDTDKFQRRELEAQRPNLVEAYERSARGTTLEAQKVKDEYQTLQENRDEGLLSGAIKRDDWVNQYYDDLVAKRAKLEQIYGSDKITKPKNALEKYIKVLQESEDPATGLMDRDKVDAGMASFTKEEMAYVDSRVGMDDTPIAAVFREVRKTRRERTELPKYRGFTADQAEDIDELWQEVRNNARSADELDMLRALRYYLATNTGLDGAVVAGVRQRINGRLRQVKAREMFDRAHPEQRIFYGSGKLTQAERAALLEMQKEAS